MDQGVDKANAYSLSLEADLLILLIVGISAMKR
jgi:hypothetical protein